MTRLDDVIAEMREFIDGFEVRPQQLEMMKSVQKAMKEGKKAAIEAPTGTGKSFGYLLPYVAVKLDNPKFRITINTNTKALQNQLQKDIDIANNVYLSLLHKLKRPIFPLRVVTLKGNSNYFCEHRFEEAKDDNLSFSLVSDVENFLKQSLPRDYENMELDISPRSWERINVEGCLKRNCAFKDQCTYFQHYSNIGTFDIVINNHALFFYRFYYSDKFWEGFDFHIFDEAHKLEKGNLDASTYYMTMRIIDSWIYQGGKFAERLKAKEEDIENWKERFVTHPMYEESKALFERLGDWFKPPNTSANVDEMGIDPFTIKLWVKNLHTWQKELYLDMMDNVLEFVKDKEENEEYQKGRSSWVLNLLHLKEFSNLSNHQDDIGVIWAETHKRVTSLKVTPRSIDLIQSPFKTGLLFTSGTMSQNRSCRPFAKRMNVNIDIDLVLSTPFPLKDQTIAYFAKHISPKMQNWKQELKREIMQLLKAGTQKTFVLFTSLKLMEELYTDLMSDMYELEGDKPLELWMQEDGNYPKVIESFKNDNVRSILFGSLTYFEGVDLKGDALTQVILTRLPYSPPHPVQSILEKKSGYAQWEAMVRFEQAFGRIIRTGSDYGTFNVLDNRVSYLTHFTELFKKEGVPITERIEDVYQFYNNRKQTK